MILIYFHGIQPCSPCASHVLPMCSPCASPRRPNRPVQWVSMQGYNAIRAHKSIYELLMGFYDILWVLKLLGVRTASIFYDFYVSLGHFLCPGLMSCRLSKRIPLLPALRGWCHFAHCRSHFSARTRFERRVLLKWIKMGATY